MIDLCRLGHFATTSRLRSLGLTERHISRLLASGLVVRVKRGLFACAHLAGEQHQALLAGGQLDCVSVLRARGIWTGHVRGLHLRIPGNVSDARQRVSRGVRLHWSNPRASSDGFSVSVLDALVQAVTCLPPDDYVAALESAVHLKAITVAELEWVMAQAPKRLARVLGELELGAESGYETKSRLWLRRAGHEVKIQYRIPRVGRIDELIDDCLAFEIDGRTHRDTFEQDRDRMLWSSLGGFPTLRVLPRHIDDEWPVVLLAIDRMVARLTGQKVATSLRKGTRSR